MVANQLRYAEKFTGEGGTVTFPLAGYEYTPEQDFRLADRPIVGADYPYDFAGVHPWAKDVGIEPIRFLLARDTPANLTAQYDALLAGLRNAGQGQLWTVDAEGDRRWAWAKLASRPGYMSAVEAWQHTPVTVRMRRYSDWFAEEQVLVSHDATASPDTWDVTNPGNAPVEAMTILLQPLAAAGFTAPTIENQENGYVTGSLRTSSATTQRFRIDTERYQAQWSTNSGVDYADDYGNLFRGPKQVGFMRLEPGVNTLRLTSGGTPNWRITVNFYPAFH